MIEVLDEEMNIPLKEIYENMNKQWKGMKYKTFQVLKASRESITLAHTESKGILEMKS